MDVNWTQIGWGCTFGLIVGLLVYAIGSYLDYRRDRRWGQELGDDNSAEVVEPDPISQASESFLALRDALSKPYPKRNRTDDTDGA